MWVCDQRALVTVNMERVKWLPLRTWDCTKCVCNCVATPPTTHPPHPHPPLCDHNHYHYHWKGKVFRWWQGWHPLKWGSILWISHHCLDLAYSIPSYTYLNIPSLPKESVTWIQMLCYTYIQKSYFNLSQGGWWQLAFFSLFMFHNFLNNPTISSIQHNAHCTCWRLSATFWFCIFSLFSWTPMHAFPLK